MEAGKTGDMRELKVELRKEIGKSVAHKLRRKGLIPGVFYGTRHAAISVALSPDDMVEALNTPKVRNTLIKMVSADAELSGRTVLVKEIQRHPTTREFLHVDLVEVYPDLPVKAMIPVITQGHPKGVDFGGTLDQPLRFVEIRCPAEKIPVSILIDVTELNIGEGIKVGQLKIEEGVELLVDPGQTVVSVVAPKMVAEAAAEEVPGEEGAAPAEGAAAPAGEAGAKAPGAAKEGAGAKKAPEAGGKKESGKKDKE